MYAYSRPIEILVLVIMVSIIYYIFLYNKYILCDKIKTYKIIKQV